jgi:hypothetical protein
VAKCAQCNADTSFEDCKYLVDNAFTLSWDQSYSGGFCGDLQTALDCVVASSAQYPSGYLQARHVTLFVAPLSEAVIDL